MNNESVSADDAVAYVFSELAATYGAAWDRSIGQAPIADVKTKWADALGSYLHSNEAKRSIMWALKNLPDRCPNSREFRTLCGHAPARVMPALPEPKADPERVAAELAKLGQLKSTRATPANGMKDWAYRLKARHEAGEKLNTNQVLCYREALHITEAA